MCSSKGMLYLRKTLATCLSGHLIGSLHLVKNKCEHLVVTKMHSPLHSEYKINVCNVHKVTGVKYLGVTINHDLS